MLESISKAGSALAPLVVDLGGQVRGSDDYYGNGYFDIDGDDNGDFDGDDGADNDDGDFDGGGDDRPALAPQVAF